MRHRLLFVPRFAFVHLSELALLYVNALQFVLVLLFADVLLSVLAVQLLFEHVHRLFRAVHHPVLQSDLALVDCFIITVVARSFATR